jgi:hypothetical protein
MAAETSITEFPFTQGQDEGQAVQVLPVGTFSRMQNARFRLNNRIGKRNGYTSKASLDGSGVALGNGHGLLTTLGPDFCAVDDRFYTRNTVSDSWAAITQSAIPTSAKARRVRGDSFPQFMPGSMLTPTPNASIVEDVNFGSLYALGYIWSAQARALFDASGWTVLVEAIDPGTGLTVHSEDVVLTSVAQTDFPFVQLLAFGNSVALISDVFTAGIRTGLASYTLINFVLGFDSPVFFTCAQSAVGAYPASSTELLLIHTLTGTPTTLRIGTIDPNTGIVTPKTTIASAGNKADLSAFSASDGTLCFGYDNGATTFMAVYSAAFVQSFNSSITAIVATATAPVMFTDGPDASDRYIATFATSGASPSIVGLPARFSGLVGTYVTQRNAEAISLPFVASTQTFIWVRPTADEGLGSPTLIRVPLPGEYIAPGADFPGPFPVQAVIDNIDIYRPASPRTSGKPLALPMLTPLGYVVALGYVMDSFIQAGTTVRARGCVLVPVRFRGEGVRYSASCVVPCLGRQFVAAAQPMWVGGARAYEAGIPWEPACVVNPVSSGGGSMTPAATYSYAAIFETTGLAGLERSGPSLPVTVVMGGANGTTTSTWTTLEFGERPQVMVRLYRTAANGSVFYFVTQFDASPGSNITGKHVFTDTAADSDIIQNEALYTFIGQELPATAYPACTFANVGGDRLWCAGGFKGDVPQCSKRFTPGLAPEFADDDAFRFQLPADCTGMAWCDAQVMFTQEGIYVISGEGPDGSGNGFFTKSRLPFDIGCIDWRSVDATDAGIFFQSARGMMLLPRGFGPPIQMSQVLETLSTYPIITSARSSYNSSGGADNSEQVVQWTCVADEAATSGVVITFDVAYQAFSVDTCGADYPATFQSGWSGDSVQAPQLMTIGPSGASAWHPFRVRNDFHSDGGLPISMQLTTGDIRLWGTFGHGVINRVGLLGVLGSACTLSATKTTDRGTRATTRGYTGVAPDYVPDQDVYLDIELGKDEQRDVTALRFSIFESSAVEGLAFIGIIIEADAKPQGFRLLQPADRVV